MLRKVYKTDNTARFFQCKIWNNKTRTYCQGPEGTTSLDCPCTAPLGVSPPCPWLRTPCQPPGTISPCPSDAGARSVSSSPQPFPACPWGPLSQAHVLAQARPVPIPREVLKAQEQGCPSCPSSCSALGWVPRMEQDTRPFPATPTGSPQCSQSPPAVPCPHVALIPPSPSKCW